MTEKPFLFIDIDGVISPYPTQSPPFIALSGFNPPMWIHPEMTSWLAELNHLYEIVWATTWGALRAHALAPLLGLPRLGVLASGIKEEQIPQHAQGLPFAWVDDRIPMWAHDSFSNYPSEFLLVIPDRDFALNRSHIDSLVAFANSLL